jgi:hypothetical protein
MHLDIVDGASDRDPAISAAAEPVAAPVAGHKQ